MGLWPMETRRDRVELAIAEAFGTGYTPWRLLAVLGNLENVTPQAPAATLRCEDPIGAALPSTGGLG